MVSLEPNVLQQSVVEVLLKLLVRLSIFNVIWTLRSFKVQMCEALEAPCMLPGGSSTAPRSARSSWGIEGRRRWRCLGCRVNRGCRDDRGSRWTRAFRRCMAAHGPEWPHPATILKGLQGIWNACSNDLGP